jgi:hypothetical protein
MTKNKRQRKDQRMVESGEGNDVRDSTEKGQLVPFGGLSFHAAAL